MKILFYGDSITDCGGYKQDVKTTGGYTKFTAQLLGDGHEYFNHGISGNTTKDLLNRYQKDVKDINPDILTLLIGINDVWRAFDSGRYTEPKQVGENISKLLDDLKSDCPNCKIIVLEPFLLPAPDKKYFRPLLAQIIEEVRAVAVQKANAFIPLDGLFAKERMTTDWQELSQDGVHPVEKGQKLIAKHLAEEIKKFL